MLVFDLYRLHKTDVDWSISAIIWDEDNPTNTIYWGSCQSLQELSKKMSVKFPKNFPSETELFMEMVTIDNLNHARGKNSFGAKYPVIISGYLSSPEDRRRANF